MRWHLLMLLVNKIRLCTHVSRGVRSACDVLQLPYHPGHDELMNHIISMAFRHFRYSEG